MSAFGGQTMSGPLERVLLRPPTAMVAGAWRAYGWRAEPDGERLLAEHSALCETLAGAGIEVVLAEAAADGNPDAIYVHDPAILSNRGAVLLRPGKAGRRTEVDAIAADLERAGVPVIARLHEPACAEGGDTLWLDERTLVVGLGYRTNEAGVAALRAALPDVDVLAFDLPHFRGPDEVLHLLSLISPLDRDLALVHLPLVPTRLVQLLEARGVRLLELPDAEFDGLGCNVLALAPRVALALDGNPRTRRLLEREGVEVLVYGGEEISRKGDGGPTCLTRALLRRE